MNFLILNTFKVVFHEFNKLMLLILSLNLLPASWLEIFMCWSPIFLYTSEYSE